MKYLIFSLFILLALPYLTYSQGDECCARHAVHGRYVLNDPMGIVGDKDAFQVLLQNLLQELLTRECFHFLTPKPVDDFIKKDIPALSEAGAKEIYLPNDMPPNEYSFEGQFLSGLNGQTEDGRPVKSSLTVSLYFEGKQRELVHQWQTQGTWDAASNGGTTWHGHANKLRQKIKNDPDIMEIIEKFEKTPQKCTVTPEKKNVNPGEVIEIKISDIKDAYGENSREFNRLIIQAYSGEILNGEVCDIGPDLKAFRVGDGSIKVKYRAPKNCDELTDRITIYNSCDVLPMEKVPMSQTSLHDRLLEKTLYINCFDASLTIHKSIDMTLNTINPEDRDSGGCMEHSEDDHKITEHIEAKILIGLKQIEAQDIPVLNQTYQYYKPEKMRIISFNYNSSEKVHYSLDYKCPKGTSTSRTDVHYSRMAEKYEITEEQYATQTPWLLVIDNETGKAVKIIPSGYEITYNVLETEKFHSERHSPDGSDNKDYVNQKKFKKYFEVGPVGEEIEDPTIKRSDTWIKDYMKRQGIDIPAGVQIPNVSNEETIKKILPDILVTTGDGKYNLGGRGNRTIREKLDHGQKEERLTYDWHMTIKKKGQH